MENAKAADDGEARKRFLQRLDDFLAAVREWATADSRVKVATRKFVVEDPFGRYDAPGAEITVASEQFVASIVPLAAVVIGADGRIDVKGPLDEAAILYLNGPGHMEATIKGVPSFSRDLFRGFSEPDWYWMSNSASREVRRVDRATFRSIIVAVSDFEIAA